MTAATNRRIRTGGQGPTPNVADLAEARKYWAEHFHGTAGHLEGYPYLAGVLKGAVEIIGVEHARCRRCACRTCWVLRFARAIITAFDEARPA
jgi:hypothetical protein